MDPKLYVAATKDDSVYLQSLAPEQKSKVSSESAPNQNNLLHIATQFRATKFATAVASDYPDLLWKQNSAGDSPLHVAAKEGLEDLVEFYIKRATEGSHDVENGRCRREELLQMVNSDDDTALHCAARLGNLKSMEMLVQADPKSCGMLNKVGESPLFLGVAVGYWVAPQIFINHAPSSASYKGPKGLTALHPTLYFAGYPTDKIKSLVEWRREMITEQDCLGWTPLHYASLFGTTEAIKLFLAEESSAIYSLGKEGESALHIAAHKGHIDAMEEIISCRPDSCYLVDNKGRTALHTAVLSDQRSVVKFILKTPMCARVMNKPDNDGNMPLHLATLFKLHAVIEILAKNESVNLKIRNKKFLTALDIFNKHDEEGLKASVTRHLLQSSIGTMTMQDLAEQEIRKMNREITIETPPNDSDTKIDESIEKKSSDLEKNNALEVNLLVATLVATVTFAAGLSVPGGNIENEGEETLFTTKVAFQVFVMFNTLAFCCSVFAVLLQFHTSHTNHNQRVRFMGIVAFFTGVAISAMFIAFALGTHVVLTKSTKFSLTPYVICSSFAFLYFALPFCDPGVEGFSFLSGPQNFVRGIIVRCIRWE